jgi:molecular chaperone HtpG
METRTFEIELDGLIKMLAKHLYADPDVFLREMLQNAHDSIVGRSEREGEAAPGGRIQIDLSRTDRTISITDNGSGLTRLEIIDYLATIGRSGTNELRLDLEGRGRTVELIGQFGIGLLSAFVVASRVDVVTRSASDKGFRWRSDGGKEYFLEESSRDAIGTTVTLYLREEYAHYLDEGLIRRIVRRYADFIGIPIHLSGDEHPCNAIVAPWHRSHSSEMERKLKNLEFWTMRFLSEQPLHIFEVDEAFEWIESGPPGTARHGRVHGVLAITDLHIPGVNARGTVDLYIQRMFINAGNRDILPGWAKFIQGVVECNELAPNAARDNVVRNEVLSAVQAVLAKRITDELTGLSRDDRARFIEIMKWHRYHVLAMAVQVQHEDFFRAIADLVPLECGEDSATIPEYLANAPRRTDGMPIIYYITEVGSAAQYQLLSSARGIRVFDCATGFAQLFLERYVETWPGSAQLVRFDIAGADAVFTPVSGSDRIPFSKIEEAYRTLFPEAAFTLQISRFSPLEIPALLTEPGGSEHRREIDDMVSDPRVPNTYREVLKRFASSTPVQMTLHLNADNPVILRLSAQADLDDPVSHSALRSLYYNAMLLHTSGALRGETMQRIFGEQNRTIELMLAKAEENCDLRSALTVRETELAEARAEGSGGLTAYVSCFVALPFSDKRAANLYGALKAVLEDAPYCWQVVRADDTVEHPGLWENLRTKMIRAHCFVAIITGDNPNVMIEVGRMEALSRPILLLQYDSNARVPSDLAGRLYEVVPDSNAESIQRHIHEILERQEAFRAQHGNLFLSETLLTRGGLGDEVSRTLARAFSTCSRLLAADPAEVSAQLGIPVALVRAAQEITTNVVVRSEGR